MNQTIGEALISLKNRSGLSLAAIAKASGYSGASSVQAFFNPAYDPPALDMAVARRLVTALLDTGTPPISSSDVFKLTGHDSVDQTTEASTPVRRNFLDADVPVFETKHAFAHFQLTERVNGLALSVINRSKALRYYPRASGLAWAEGAFAFHVVGPSMSPRFRDGEPVFVSGSRAPAIGDDVVVYLHTKPKSSNYDQFDLFAIGQLVDTDDFRIEILQYREGKTITIPHRLIIDVDRVAPWAEVCGLPYA